MTFKKIREKNYPEMKMNVTVYEHVETGAQHYHTAYDTVQNSFNVSFTTLPENSNGLPHILEHSVLNGSEKFPMHGVFFAMQGRNFETFSNAMTGFDTTQYPFSTIDKAGFFNLLSVYLDAVFFPNLEKEVFLQEGWRYAFQNPNDSTTPLQYSGVVYNEMKGAFTSPVSVAYVEMLKQAFANTQYENYAGGHPLEIPNLTYEEFVAFHKKFYHPSNATFYTFGSIPVEEIHDKFENWVLKRFDKQVIDNKIDTEKLNICGQQYSGTHPGQEGYLLFKGYKIPDFKTVEDMYAVDILMTLLQSGKNNINDFFLQKDIGVSSEGIGLLPVSRAALYMFFKMDDLNHNVLNESLEQYFSNLLKNGIDLQELDNIFDSVELQVREGEGASHNLGMSTIEHYIKASRYGLDSPEDVNSLEIFKNLRKKFQNKDYFNNLLNTYFIDNVNQFEFTSQADPEFGQKLEYEAQEQLKLKQASLSEEEKLAIVEQSQKLEEVRKKPKDFSILPALKLEDVSIEYSNEESYTEAKVGNSTVYSFVNDTKGVSYLQYYYPLQAQSDEEVFYKNLAVELLRNLNLKGMSIEETALWRESKLGDLSVSLAIKSQNTEEFTSYYLLATKGLSEYTKELVEKPLTYTKEMSFDNKDVIVSAINNMWRDYISSYQDQANRLAITEAQSGFSSTMALKKKITTDYKNVFLRGLVEKIEKEDFSFIADIEKAYKEMFAVAPTIFFCGDEQAEKVMLDNLEKNKDHLMLKSGEKYSTYIDKINNNVALDVNIPINHIAYVLPVASADEDDGGKLKVLASYIQPYLITNVREKGGAYGANASYTNNGLFTLFSYRDPHSLNTIDVFNELGNHLLTSEIDVNEVNVSKLNILKGFNKPKEKIHKALIQFNKLLKEEGLDEKKLIDSVLSTTPEDLKELAKKYLIGQTPSVAIATNEETINKSFNEWNKEVISEKKPDNSIRSKSVI